MDEQLIEAARIAQQNAYAPYSGYFVGAAILDADGQVWTGCNVENISYGLSICAERTAVCKMVSAGSRQVKMVAVSTRDGGTPCGMCLQTLLEFSSDPATVRVVTVSASNEVRSFLLSELMPFGFSSEELGRT